MALLLLLLGCSSAVLRIPGPLDGLSYDTAPPRAEPAARPAPVAPTGRPASAKGDAGALMAKAAGGFVGASRIVVDGTRFRYDCSGLVEAVLATAGAPFAGSSEDLFLRAREEGLLHRRRTPSPGDVAFFDDTYDRDGDGRRNDPLSHSAVVESVADDGTITLVHVGSNGVVRFRMNLRHPEDRENADGVVINDYLRARRAGDSPRTRYLAAELWVGFASYWERVPAGRSTT